MRRILHNAHGVLITDPSFDKIIYTKNKIFRHIDRYFDIFQYFYNFNISINISIFFQYVFIFLNLFRYPFNIINTILSYFSIFAKNFPTFLDKLSIKFSSYRKQFRYTRNYFNIIKFYINTAFLRNVLRYRSDF